MTEDNPKAQESSEQESEEAEEEGLFRREVLEEQGNKMVGEVLILLPPRLSTFAIFYSLMAFAAAMVLLFGRYQRKERAPGILVPSQGLVQVLAVSDGRIAEILSEEGEWVQQGQALLKISRESFMDDKSGKFSTQLLEFKAEQSRLESQRQQLAEKQEIQQKEAESKIQNLLESRRHSLDVLGLKQKQLRQIQISFAAAERLMQEKIIARTEYDSQLAQFTSVQQSISEENQRQSELSSKFREMRLEKDAIQKDYAAALSTLESRISEIKGRQVETESQKEVLLKAPADGYVSGLRSFVGQPVQPGFALLTLVPKNLQLESHVFVSSKAAPFIQDGQKVWLQFEALSPTKYGVFPGTVQSVSRSALDPRDVKDFALDAPRYLVKIKLEQTLVELYQAELGFKAGLLVDADILLDQRRLIEWILDPLLRARGGDGLEKP